MSNDIILIKQMLTYKEVLLTDPLPTTVKIKSISSNNIKKLQGQTRALINIVASKRNEFPVHCCTAAIKIIIKEYNDIATKLFCRTI